MKERILYEVEHSYTGSFNCCYNEFRYFETREEQQAYAEEKRNQPNVYRVVETTVYTKEGVKQ